MIFYELASDVESKWTRACSIKPSSHNIRWSCDECLAAVTYPAGSFELILEGGSDYPDFLLCGAYPLFIVSERVAVAFRKACVSSFMEYPLTIAGIQNTSLTREEAPNYLRLEVTGECRVDPLASGATARQVCTRCGRLQTEPAILKAFRLFQGSWDGSHLFRDHVFFPRVVFCTEGLANLIRTEGFTNASLEKIG